MRYHNDERRGLVSHYLPVSDGDRGHCRNKYTNYEFNMMQNRMAGNWILFLDVDLFTENRSLEVLQSIKRHAIARKD